MKLGDFNFNAIPVKGLAIFVDNKLVESGFIEEVLKKIPQLKDYKIKDTNYYFDEFVIRL